MNDCESALSCLALNLFKNFNISIATVSKRLNQSFQNNVALKLIKDISLNVEMNGSIPVLFVDRNRNTELLSQSLLLLPKRFEYINDYVILDSNNDLFHDIQG
jgi:hypothetical protein